MSTSRPGRVQNSRNSILLDEQTKSAQRVRRQREEQALKDAKRREAFDRMARGLSPFPDSKEN